MLRNPTMDLIIVLVIVLLIWGPKRLPGLGRQLGQGLRDFKESITGEDRDEEQTERPALPPHTASSAVPAATPSTAPVAAQTPESAGAQAASPASRREAARGRSS